MTNCPVCLSNPAKRHPIYGVMPCLDCEVRRATNDLPNVQIEFASEDMKKQRTEYARSIIQPYRSGKLSKEYLELYGTQNIQPTAEEIQKADYTWKDTFSHNVDLSKTK